MVQAQSGGGWRFEIILFISQQTFGVISAHEASGTLVPSQGVCKPAGLGGKYYLIGMRDGRRGSGCSQVW